MTRSPGWLLAALCAVLLAVCGDLETFTTPEDLGGPQPPPGGFHDPWPSYLADGDEEEEDSSFTCDDVEDCWKQCPPPVQDGLVHRLQMHRESRPRRSDP